MTVTCIHTGHYDLNFVSECLRITLRRLKIPKFSGGMNPLTNCVFVSCQRSARRKSSMTVTCIHTGHYDLNFVSECLRITLRRLKIPKFSGGMNPLTNCVFVSCQRSARRKSSMTVTCIHTGHYDLNFVSECLRITLRRLKIPKFSGGMNPLTNCVFVSCQRSARRKSSMTVTCIHTGHYDLNFVSECLRITLRGLKILKFSGGGMPPDPPTNCGLRPQSPVHHHSQDLLPQTQNPRLNPDYMFCTGK